MLKIIVAMAKNKAIGKKNKLLWYNKDELLHFKNLTLNNKVIMGKNTYLSIGKILENRENIVISRTLKNIKGIKIYDNLEKCLLENKDAYIIGGAEIYKQCIDYVDELHISYIDKEYIDADAYFPDFEDKYVIKSVENKKNFEYRIYEKIRGKNER